MALGETSVIEDGNHNTIMVQNRPFTYGPIFDLGYMQPDEKKLLKRLLPFTLQNENAVTKEELRANFANLEIVYAGLTNTFKNIVLDETISEDEKNKKLKLIRASLGAIAGMLAKTYGTCLSMPANGKDWCAEYDKIQGINIEKDTKLELVSDRPKTIGERLTQSIKNFGNTLYGFITSPIDTTRSIVRRGNWWRLFTGRFADMFTEAGLISKSTNFSNLTKTLNVIGKPISIAGMAIYSGLFLTNLAVVAKHTLGIGIDDEEKEYSAFTRFKTQMELKWSEMANDLAWFSVGAATFFLLSSTVGINLTVGFYLFDVANASLKLWEKYHNHKKAINQIDDQLKDESLTKEERDILCEQRKNLGAHINHEKKNLLLSVGVTTALFLGVVGTITALTVLMPPAFPLISAVVLVAAMAVEKALSKWFGWNAPKTKIDDFKQGEMPKLEGETLPAKNENDLNHSSTLKIGKSLSAPELSKDPQINQGNIIQTVVDSEIDKKQQDSKVKIKQEQAPIINKLGFEYSKKEVAQSIRAIPEAALPKIPSVRAA